MICLLRIRFLRRQIFVLQQEFLIDCSADIGERARPKYFRASLNLTFEPGLSELLRGQAKASDVIRPTPAANLWMIPAGRADRTVIQALARDDFQKVLASLRNDFDIIIIDSSPVLPVAQTLLIGKQADAVILSVMHDHSRMPPVYAAHHRLSSLGIRVLGAVFHKAKSDFYGYGYTGSRDYRYRLPEKASVKA